MTKEIEELLGRRDRGENCEEEMIVENIGLVKSVIARNFKNFASDYFDDMLQSGVIGLLHAFRNFDESRGIEFSSYATRVIIGMIAEDINNNFTVIKLPKSLRTKEFRETEDFKNLVYPVDINETEGMLLASPVEEYVYKKELYNIINEILGVLTIKQRRVITMLYGLQTGHPMRYTDIARNLGISRQAVTMLAKNGMKRLQDCEKSQQLRDYI